MVVAVLDTGFDVTHEAFSLSDASRAALTQSVTAQGVTAQNIVIAAAAGDSFTPYSTHGVRVKTQTANTLTFACEIVPTVDLTANVVILA